MIEPQQPDPPSFSCELPVPVRFDADSAGWSLGGLPMLLVPRHFVVRIQQAMEQGLGPERARELTDDASQAAARTWCAQQAGATQLRGPALFTHYLASASRRGWGRMLPERIDLEAGCARVRVENSAYVAEYGRDAGRPVCHLFGGSFAGGLSFVSEAAGLPGAWRATETQCAADGAVHCMFEVWRAAPAADVVPSADPDRPTHER